MDFSGDRPSWLQLWRESGTNMKGGGGVGPSFDLDLAACWVDNIRDLIQLQNNFWWGRKEWSNGRLPMADYSGDLASENRKYWGWNEIPVDRAFVIEPAN